jgi:uncharacterized protein DUF5324
VTRIDSARAAAGSAKESVRHAAEAMAPYAETARDTATRYAHEAGERVGPKVSAARRQARKSARSTYGAHVAPRLAQARGAIPPEVDKAARRAAKQTRRAVEQAGDYAGPRLESAYEDVRAVAVPAGEAAFARGTAAFEALRSEVTAKDIRRLARRRTRRARTGRLARRLGLLGLLAGGAYAAWRWWDKQANPDWLVEPPEATEAGDRSGAHLASVNGSGGDRTALDPNEEEAKEAERRRANRH